MRIRPPEPNPGLPPNRLDLVKQGVPRAVGQIGDRQRRLENGVAGAARVRSHHQDGERARDQHAPRRQLNQSHTASVARRRFLVDGMTLM